MPSLKTSHRVVVIGGGYAGTAAANRLRSRRDVEVTLVNPRPQFVERIRLHQLVADSGAATADFGGLLADGVRLVVDTATRIDTAGRRVELASGDPIGYDYLVYAVGSTAGTAAGVAGAAEHAWRIAEYDHAVRLRAAVRDLPADAPLVVVGGGLTAIETAAELAGAGRHVALVTGRAHLPSLSEKARQEVGRQLAALGVDQRGGVSVVEVASDRVLLSDQTSIRSALTIWAAGFGIPDLARRSGLATDPAGRLITDRTLTSVDDPRIVAAGDSAAPDGLPLRMSCQAAIPLGLQAARTVLSRLDGRRPDAVDQGFLATCISLGRDRGVVQLSRIDDSPRGAVVPGRAGAIIKELICRSTVGGLRFEARRPGGLPWIRGSKAEARATARV
ncbi:NAD(P)/FAD-dependent oxidoreductase [Microlunatus sp. Gsoil 973]|uniref:NAD(P)/FAD-dependent oxidoreductase n=1 Tax=Microlunatus sp. Gsoil 973 TaxID=2672569 RepID=UPI0012B46CBD|nr:FAD-dependent oxidoreductase [Microlunatus sp. Gsoil 973]QGN32387.1 FAD-dependent oxidoreductase [Microlunatus sp. Gsoil 973]